MVHIFFPKKNFILNVKKHISWLNVTEWASHFRAYDKDDQIKIFKHVIPKILEVEDYYGFINIIIIYSDYLFNIFNSCSFSNVTFFYNQNFNNLLNFSLIFLLAIFPIFIHEFTKGLKVAKAYFRFYQPY